MNNEFVYQTDGCCDCIVVWVTWFRYLYDNSWWNEDSEFIRNMYCESFKGHFMTWSRQGCGISDWLSSFIIRITQTMIVAHVYSSTNPKKDLYNLCVCWWSEYHWNYTRNTWGKQIILWRSLRWNIWLKPYYAWVWNSSIFLREYLFTSLHLSKRCWKVQHG